MTEAALAAAVAANLGTTPPALSATSDAPTAVVGGPALSASNAAPDVNTSATAEPVQATDLDAHHATQPKTDAAQPDPEADPAADPAAAKVEKSAKDDTPAWQKAEITKERNRRREADDKAAAAEKTATEAQARLDTALKALEALTNKPAETTETPRPARKDFDDPDAYDAALVEWSSKTAADAARAEAAREFEAKTVAEKQAEVERIQKEQSDAVLTQWQDKRTKALEEFPDYEAVVEADDLQISIPMRDAIMAADNGPALAYHLGKNPAEASRIAALNPMMQLIEMGRMMAAVEAQAKVLPTKVPTPPSHITVGNAAVTKALHEISDMDEYAARRQEQIRQQRTH